MRGDTVYRVYGCHEGREKDTYFSAFRTRAEAEQKIETLQSRADWVAQYHNRGFVIQETVVTVDFEVPALPKPRDTYVVRGTPKPNRPETWDSTVVEVLRRTSKPGVLETVCSFERNYALLGTFEPFRQGARELALISPDYTKTAVLDLQTGKVIAEEANGGFCPVGFYVPDWWDINDGSVIPGSEYWRPDYEWPTGDFGFVWGCHWGDDASWKVQYLDLRQVQHGILRRDERFGYVELATTAYDNPCFQPDLPPSKTSAPPFVRLWRDQGRTQVTFAVEMAFDLDSGSSEEWQRLKIARLE